MKLASIKGNKNLTFVVVALVLGLLAALTAVRYVQKAVEVRTAPSVDMTAVAVPKADMPPGTIVTTDELAVREVPADMLPADAVTPQNVADYSGRMLRAPVRQGAPLAASALVPLYDQFSRVIKTGSVGYTLSVDETNSISGMIAPGDHVDILLIVDQDGQQQKGPRVMPLLENINVLATGNRIGDTPADDDSQGYSNITLELEPKQAERLAIAGKSGSVRLVLRQVKDDRPFGLRGMSQQELLRASGVSSGGGVEFIIGKKG